jgi:serpin B
LCCSPYSVASALALTALGAKGETFAQMAKVLHLPDDPVNKGAAWKALNDYVRANQGERTFELHLANALWGQRGVRFREAFLADARDRFEATLEAVDFANTAGARKTINGWVSEQTHGHIQELVPADRLSPDVRLVVTSAIAFRGRWAKPFDPKRTENQAYHVRAGQTVQAPLMHRHSEYSYAEDDGVKLLQLPYAGSHLAMLFILPKRVDGLPAVERQLTAEQLSKWVGRLHSTDLHVAIPRFRFSTEYELRKPLEALGMSLAFDPKRADLSGIAESVGPLWIDSVGHSAFIDVFEEGTEAAAATRVLTTTEAKTDEPPAFVADHPFLFLIRDTKTGCVLFVGRLADPTK